MKSRAFTLIELLVVVGIIGILVSILTPGLRKVREASNTIKCVSNLRQIGFGNKQFALEHDGYSAGGGHIDKKPDGTGGSSVAWQQILSVEHFRKDGTIPRSGAGGSLYCPTAAAGLLSGSATQRSYAINVGLASGGPVFHPRQFPKINSAYYKPVTGKNWGWDDYYLGDKLSDWRNPQTKVQFTETDRGADSVKSEVLVLGSPGYFPWTANESWSFRHQYKINICYLDNHVETVPFTPDVASQSVMSAAY